jgi:C-terminal processing protease CtpA/Prc
VELEATFAKSAVIGPREGDDRKMGYIKLPKFYVDFYNEKQQKLRRGRPDGDRKNSKTTASMV